MNFKTLIVVSTTLFLGFRSTAQRTIVFEDESNRVIDGILVGELKKYSYSNPDEVELIESSYYKWDEDTLEISIYGEFVTKEMDDLRVYRIHKNQINFNELELKDETDFEGRFLHYSLNFSALETEFNYTSYSYENATGDKLPFSYFNLNSDKIEGLEALEHLITINN